MGVSRLLLCTSWDHKRFNFAWG